MLLKNRKGLIRYFARGSIWIWGPFSSVFEESLPILEGVMAGDISAEDLVRGTAMPSTSAADMLTPMQRQIQLSDHNATASSVENQMF